MQTALQAWHMGKVITAYRNHPHHVILLTQETVAGWVGITQAQLSRIERGPQPKDLDRLIQWARVLAIPQEVLWFRLPAGIPIPMRDEPLLSSSPPPATTGPVTDSMEKPSQPDPPASIHASAMHSFRNADRMIGGGHLYPAVVRYLHTAVGPDLFTDSDERNGPQAFTAGAALTEMAGWMAHDAGHDPLAWNHFRRSRDFAQLGGDRQLLAHIYASMSHLAAHSGKPREAIQFAECGHETLAAGPAQYRLLARLLAMQARGFAAIGDHARVAQLLLRAEDALLATEEAEPSIWVNAFDAGSLASEAARCFSQIGDLKSAQEHAQRIISLRPTSPSRSRAFGQIRLAKILILRQELDEACPLIRQILDSTRHLSSYLVLKELIDARDMLISHRSRSTAVAELLPTLDRELTQRLDIR